MKNRPDFNTFPPVICIVQIIKCLTIDIAHVVNDGAIIIVNII